MTERDETSKPTPTDLNTRQPLAFSLSVGPMAPQPYHPEQLFNEDSEEEFLRADLAPNPQAARAQLADLAGLRYEEIPEVHPSPVALRSDPQRADDTGMDAWYVPCRFDDPDAVFYWRTQP